MNKIFYFLVYLVFLTTPLESVTIVPNVSVVKLVTFILVLVTLLNGTKIFTNRDPFLKIFLIYTFLTILSSIWSIDRETTLKASFLMILPSYIVTLIVYSAIQNEDHLEKIFMSYTIGCGIAAITAIYLFMTGFRFIEDSRLTVLGQDQNELSFILSFGIVSIIYLIKYTKRKKNQKYFY